MQDESQGGNDQEIEFRTINARLLLSTQDLSGYDLLPIAQIKRAGGGEAVPSLDEEYMPPVMSIDAWPGLGRDLVRAIYDVIGQKIEVLSEQIVNRGVGLDSRHPGDLERVLMLSALNEAYNTLGVLSFAKGVHPLVAYTELCRIAGSLAIFSPERRLGEVPQYDHDDLARIFREIPRPHRAIDQLRAGLRVSATVFRRRGAGAAGFAGAAMVQFRLAMVHRSSQGRSCGTGSPRPALSGPARLETGERAAGGNPVSKPGGGLGDQASRPGDSRTTWGEGLDLLRDSEERRPRLARRADDENARHAAAGFTDYQPGPPAGGTPTGGQRSRTQRPAGVRIVRRSRTELKT